MAYWSEHIEKNEEIRALKRDFEEVKKVDEYLKYNDGFKEVMNDKKRNMQMFMKKEPNSRVTTIKFHIKNMQVHVFNLLSLIYETDLYELWFPFCKKSFTVK